MMQLGLDFSNTSPRAARAPGRKAEPARARRSDPATSQRAAERAEVFTLSHEGKILAALLEAPGTYKEIADRCGLERHAVARRLPYMAEHGVDKTDEERGGCTVWRVKR